MDTVHHTIMEGELLRLREDNSILQRLYVTSERKLAELEEGEVLTKELVARIVECQVWDLDPITVTIVLTFTLTRVLTLEPWNFKLETENCKRN